ncbi:hypothetical protein, conserved [Trypanosoma brucei gambiense DAL972]|uniref:Uncharacterized protein n=2 Tax=Trypanosoma brucei TaxID=5691 RepID=C9ZVX9_TRYB9|nr:hypothetical protein, conserved [Trypanosoma brucei gambiense DAL972]RHW73011.1 hypothetical protein DPX39_040066200 [Trypanosoma brucei equiperdum]CBH13567.1 hypothetical protein, conserved [Trypanosoma brucei gambiense DAL972]|eukprot:XP_011775844.1 hypothetical protein, conserved [Trypanosoma brucei gambiense DAL972]
MPVCVLVPLHQADTPAVTEEMLGSAVRVAFNELRMIGLGCITWCSVSSARLQQEVRRRYPLAYDRHIMCGRWAGKWHHFVEGVAGLRCFLYSTTDYAEAAHLATHIAVSELRCCLQEDIFSLVRLSDEGVGARLLSDVLEHTTLNHNCWQLALEAVITSQLNGRPRWLSKAVEAPHVVELLRQINEPPFPGRRPGSERLRRCAAHELVKLLSARYELVRHVSGSQLRRHVTQCLCTWGAIPATFNKWDEERIAVNG